MYQKETNDLKQFDNFHSRLRLWIEFELHLEQFKYSFYFVAPENVNLNEIKSVARNAYELFPQNYSWSKKYCLTLKAIINYLEDNY